MDLYFIVMYNLFLISFSHVKIYQGDLSIRRDLYGEFQIFSKGIFVGARRVY